MKYVLIILITLIHLSCNRQCWDIKENFYFCKMVGQPGKTCFSYKFECIYAFTGDYSSKIIGNQLELVIKNDSLSRVVYINFSEIEKTYNKPVLEGIYEQ